ncbi:Glutamine amidotransferase [Balamuthia mandrillaris]
MEKGDKFAILWCEDAPKWEGFESLLVDLIREEEPTTAFVVYQAINRQLPPLEELSSFKGLIVSGSRWSAYDDEPWINDLKQWLKGYWELVKREPERTPRMVAICFGAQLVAHSLGGLCTPNSHGRFIFGTEEATPTACFVEKAYVKAALKDLSLEELPKQLTLLESHGDAVAALPAEAELLASTATNLNEIYGVADHIIAIQGHPEFTPSVMLEKIYPSLKGGRLTEAEDTAALVSLEKEASNALVAKVLQRFLKQ